MDQIAINKLVSIILPVFNCEAYVSKAIESILNQSYQNFELIILNDASTDHSDRVIKTYSDSRINYISFEKNTQKIGAVNHALTLVKGEFIAFQDADDWSDKKRIEKQVEQFMSDNILICFTGYTLGINNKMKKEYRIDDGLLKAEFHDQGFLMPGNYYPTVCATMMIRRSVLSFAPGYHNWFKGKIGEDIHWVYRILKNGKGCTIPEPLYYYNYNRPGSFTHQFNFDFSSELLYNYKLISKIIEQDINYGNDILATYNSEQLIQLELKACKESLSDAFRLIQDQKQLYETSASFQIGQFCLYPVRLLKRLLRS